MKPEEDGTILPHYYCDLEDIRRLLSEFSIVKLRQIEAIYDGRTSWQDFVLAARS